MIGRLVTGTAETVVAAIAATVPLVTVTVAIGRPAPRHPRLTRTATVSTSASRTASRTNSSRSSATSDPLRWVQVPPVRTVAMPPVGAVGVAAGPKP